MAADTARAIWELMCGEKKQDMGASASAAADSRASLSRDAASPDALKELKAQLIIASQAAEENAARAQAMQRTETQNELLHEQVNRLREGDPSSKAQIAELRRRVQELEEQLAESEAAARRESARADQATRRAELAEDVLTRIPELEAALEDTEKRYEEVLVKLESRQHQQRRKSNVSNRSEMNDVHKQLYELEGLQLDLIQETSDLVEQEVGSYWKQVALDTDRGKTKMQFCEGLAKHLEQELLNAQSLVETQTVCLLDAAQEADDLRRRLGAVEMRGREVEEQRHLLEEELRRVQELSARRTFKMVGSQWMSVWKTLQAKRLLKKNSELDELNALLVKENQRIKKMSEESERREARAIRQTEITESNFAHLVEEKETFKREVLKWKKKEKDLREQMNELEKERDDLEDELDVALDEAEETGLYRYEGWTAVEWSKYCDDLNTQMDALEEQLRRIDPSGVWDKRPSLKSANGRQTSLKEPKKEKEEEGVQEAVPAA